MPNKLLANKISLDVNEAQQIRSQRTMLAAAVSLSVVMVMCLMAAAGMLPKSALAISGGLVVAECLIFLGLIKSGLNRKFRDPSLTIAQTLGASVVLVYAAYNATAFGHGVALMIIPVAFTFSSFRFGTRRLWALVGALAAMVALELALRWTISVHAGEPVAPILVGLCTMIVTLLTLTLVGGQMNDLRTSTQSERAASHLAMTKLSEAVITVDLTHQVKFANAGAQALFSVYAPQSQQMIIDDVCQFVDQAPLSDLLTELTIKATLDGVASATADQLQTRTVMGTIKTADNVRRDVELSVSPLTTARGALEGYVLVVRDVTESRRLMDELKHAASHDILTGLLNRRGFLEVISRLMPAPGARKSTMCVLVMDLDQFKIVNDACGHHAGDELLRNVASMMRAVAPESARLARLGGDEFGLAIPGCSLAEAEQVGEQLIQEFAEMRFLREGRTFKVGASIGVAQYTEDCADVDSLLTRADSACFLAKERGKNCVQTYSVGDEEVSRHQRDLSWVSRINEALEQDRFVLYAQKIIATNTGEGSDASDEHHDSYELLIRMIDENNNIVEPDAFLPSAERFNLITTLDRQVIRLAARNLSAYASAGLSIPHVAINLSPASLRDEKLASFISGCLNNVGLSAELFTFEVAETAAIFDLERARACFSSLKAVGCRIALDDVGSGFNSFYNLRHLPIDQVKIDGGYVSTVCESPLDKVFIESIQNIANVLNVETVAEFVESDAIEEEMGKIGVHFVQGYGVHRPEPLAALLDTGAPGRREPRRSDTAATESSEALGEASQA